MLEHLLEAHSSFMIHIFHFFDSFFEIYFLLELFFFPHPAGLLDSGDLRVLVVNLIKG